MSTDNADTATAQDANAASDTGTPQNMPEIVTREQYDALLRRVDGMSAALRKLDAQSHQDDQSTDDKSKVQLRMSAADRELKRRVEELESLQKSVRDAAVLTGLRQAVIDAGIDKTRMPTAVKVLRADIMDRIALSDDMQHINITENDGETPLIEFVRQWLKSDEGKLFLPPVEPPHVKSGSGYKTQDGRHPWLDKTAKDISKLKDHNPELFARLIRDHPSEWASKIAQFAQGG